MVLRHRDAPTVPVLLSTFLLGVFLAAGPLAAGAQALSESEEDGSPTALSVGNLSTDFTFGGSGENAGVYNYNTNSQALMISGSNGSLLVDYASSLDTGGFDRDTRRTIGAEALFGGNATLFDDFLRLPLSIYVPIRVNLDYRYVQPQNPDLTNLHRGAGGLGAGGGAELQLPVGPDFIKDNLFVRGSAVLVPAVATSLGGNDADEIVNDDPSIETSRTRMRRMLNINLEALFTELLGESTGVMAGYTFRAYGRSQQEPSSVGDVIDAATLEGDYRETSVQHMIRIGLSW
ncbi:MAG: hypothetical protein V5A20_05310 [Salinibacter sp.]|uniref:hypothetical protein n=1 Tax=Salinibacter sp. TaxID=2065818 RepID=UPI002FC28729